MKNIFSNSFALYFSEFYKIVLVSLVTYAPLLIAHALIVNYIYKATLYTEYPNLIGDTANAIFMLTFLTVGQVPFIKFTLLDGEGEDNPIKRSLAFTLEKVIPLYIFACIYALLICVGGLFFIIPGLLVLFLFYFVPFFIADNTMTFRSAIKKSASFLKKNLIKVCLLIVLLSIVQLFFENVLVTLLSFYTDVYITLLILKILFLILILPLQTIIVANIYKEWKPG
ncbi:MULTISPECIES: hypothetical protein [Bacillaceae]|uniref:hypothetical protein n=1 Tax=Bacillaceae TaxID=186817 RepID=UPI002963EE1B|nr:hypothetical protein [Bacillus infantis]MDW2879578.1 hypothetical protein [Bacillus infantis]